MSGPPLPPPRGPISEMVCARLSGGSPGIGTAPDVRAAQKSDPWDEDFQLALYLCYELHYQGFAGVDTEWEWDHGLLRLRRELERSFLAGLRERTHPVGPLNELLNQLLVESPDGSGPSHFLLAEGERWQAREYLAHRSLYHLKEADPQLWVVPRLRGEAKAAFMSIQYDEYGAGRADRAHARLFAEMMADFGLDSGYGQYLDAVAGPALAATNLVSFFGLHRALRGALVGQFTSVEVTSSPGSARLVTAFERMGAGPAGTRFYREHVEADAVHEQLVRHGVIRPLLQDEPELEPDIAFGLASGCLVEADLGDHLLQNWRQNRSSLRGGPLDGRARRPAEAVAGVAERVPPAASAGAQRHDGALGADRRAVRQDDLHRPLDQHRP